MMQVSGGFTTMSRNALSLLILAALTSLTCITSCSPPPPENTDNTTNPPAVTPVTLGYTLFQGNTEGLLISFEYPENWRFDGLYTIKSKAGIALKFGSDSTESYVAIESMSLPYDESPIAYENAHDLLQEQVWWHSSFKNPGQGDYSMLPPPDLVSRTITLGGVEGEWISFSSDKFDPLYYHSPNPKKLHIIYRHAAVDYKGCIYWIRYQVNTNVDDDEKYKQGFDHILATFRFLE